MREEQTSLWLKNANATILAGCSLAHTLYDRSIDVLLIGPLGAGKTTFLQGLLHGLGHHLLPDGLRVRQMDLHRLSTEQSSRMINRMDDDAMRCIEWADRLAIADWATPSIVLTFREEDRERHLDIIFRDADLPSTEEIEDWRRTLLLPAALIDHCEAVAAVSRQLADALVSRGIIVRTTLLTLSARLHDLLRPVDFRTGGEPAGFTATPEQREQWAGLRAEYADCHHEEACARFLQHCGYPAAGTIIEAHGVHHPPTGGTVTIEQQLLYLADKYVAGTRLVTLDERFADFARRYDPRHIRNQELLQWLKDARKIERLLFPDGPPRLRQGNISRTSTSMIAPSDSGERTGDRRRKSRLSRSDAQTTDSRSEIG